MPRYNDEAEAPRAYTTRGLGSLANAPAPNESRTASDQANNIANMLGGVLEKADGLCSRLGRPATKHGPECAPPSLLLGALDVCEQNAQQLHDAMDFLLAHL